MGPSWSLHTSQSLSCDSVVGFSPVSPQITFSCYPFVTKPTLTMCLCTCPPASLALGTTGRLDPATAATSCSINTQATPRGAAAEWTPVSRVLAAGSLGLEGDPHFDPPWRGGGSSGACPPGCCERLGAWP